MERNFRLLAINIGLKAVGAISGAFVFFATSKNFDGEPMEVAILAGYCALGYMAGNLLSAISALMLIDANNTEKENKGE